MRKLLLLALIAALPVDAEPLPPPAWIAGDWCGKLDNQILDERWTAPERGHMFGVTQTFLRDRLTAFEYLRIERKDDAWVFIAQPGGKPPTTFTEVERSDHKIVFENTAHDFPQRIEYARDDSGLHAAISGPGNDGKPLRIAYEFAAGRCPPSPGEGPPADAALAPKTMAEVLAATGPDDWRKPDPAHLLYLELQSGRVVIELAAHYAPQHVANIKTLVAQKYFDGLAILRSQDNFVVQWGDPNTEDEAKRKDIGKAKRTLPPEFERDIDAALEFVELPDADGYAPQVGFSAGFPAGRDAFNGKTWLAHCYGVLGVGRDTAADSGGGTELYVVTGHAPRQLDRNITVVGRVLKGMELLSTLPRGTAALGFYDKPAQRTPIKSIRLAADVPEAEREQLEVMRTDSASFKALIEARRNRRDEWYKRPAGHIDVCSVPIPVRPVPAP